MNRIYSLVWNRARRVLQVAPEMAATRGGHAGSGSTRAATRRAPLPLACAAALAMGVAALPAWAGTWTVTQATDDGTGTTPGSLSWAIDQASLNPGSIIVIAAGTGPITESGTLPALGQDTTLQGNLAIVGPGAAPLSIKPAGSGAITVQLGDGSAAGAGFVTGAGGNGGANASVPGVAGGAGGGGIRAVDLAADATLAVNSGSGLTGGIGGSGGNASYHFPANGVPAGAGGNGGAAGSALSGTGSVLTNNGIIAGGLGGNGGYGGAAVYSPGHGGSGGNGGAGVRMTDGVVTNHASIAGGKGGFGGAGGFGLAHGGAGGTGGAGGAGVTGSGFTLTNSGGIYGGYGWLGGDTGMDAPAGPGGNGGTGGAGVSGTDFTLTNSDLVKGGAGGIAGGGTGGTGGTGGAGVTGSGFSATNNGVVTGGYGGPSVAIGGTGGAGVDGHGFTLTNDRTITGGGGGSNLVNGGSGGYGGAGVGGTGFTLTNNGAIKGGAGGTGNAVGGNGGAGVSGAGFTLFNTVGDTITGGNGGSSGVAPGNGGAGIVSTGGARVTTSGSIVGGTGASGQADAIDFSGGGNVLTLEDSLSPPFLYSFTGNVVSTSGTGASAIHGGDTLALGGSVAGAFNGFDLAQVVATPAAWTGTVQYAGFNRFEKTGSSTWLVFDSATFAGGATVRAGTLQLNNASVYGGSLVVDAGATLDGQSFGLFAPTTINPGATLAPGIPGDPAQAIFIEDPLSMLGRLAVTIDGTSALGGVAVEDAATFGASSFFDFALGNDTTQQAGDTFPFFDAGSLLNFADVGNHFHCSGLMAGLRCMLDMNGAGTGLVLTLDASGTHGVPEPGSLGMFGLGLLLLGGGIGWRTRRDSKEA